MSFYPDELNIEEEPQICPVCEDASEVKISGPSEISGHLIFCCECFNCGHEGPFAMSIEQAIEFWNSDKHQLDYTNYDRWMFKDKLILLSEMKNSHT